MPVNNLSETAAIPLQQTAVRIPADAGFLPVATAFVESSSLALGLKKPEALRMTLATEELFLHLCGEVLSCDHRIRIRCINKGYFVQTDFAFPGTGFSMQSFNLTAAPGALDPFDFDEMRLILASRSVDRLKILRDGNEMRISLIKEKKYPREPKPTAPLVPFGVNETVIRRPCAEELKFLARLTLACYPDTSLPAFFQFPGMLIDMVQSGRYHAVIAAGPAGEIAGGMLWHLPSDRTVEALGPYVFCDSGADRIAPSLIEACVGDAGRTSAVAMICHPPVAGPCPEYFEFLGEMDQFPAVGPPVRKPSWFRLMQEDMGSVAWAPAEIESYLRKVYGRLFLPREIRKIADDGEIRPAHSVLSTRMDRPGSRADLDILWPGADIAENLLRHIALFQSEGIRNVVFEIDLGCAWKSAVIPCLLGGGFQPVQILPYAGQGDILLFQLVPCTP